MTRSIRYREEDRGACVSPECPICGATDLSCVGATYPDRETHDADSCTGKYGHDWVLTYDRKGEVCVNCHAERT